MVGSYAVQTAVNGGSELLIFVGRVADSHDLSVIARAAFGYARRSATSAAGVMWGRVRAARGRLLD